VSLRDASATPAGYSATPAGYSATPAGYSGSRDASGIQRDASEIQRDAHDTRGVQRILSPREPPWATSVPSVQLGTTGPGSPRLHEDDA
jgi:hypothetical protein